MSVVVWLYCQGDATVMNTCSCGAEQVKADVIEVLSVRKLTSKSNGQLEASTWASCYMKCSRLVVVDGL